MADRYKSKLIVDLFLERKNENGEREVLLSLRKNTGHHDNEYDLPGGHVEANEYLYDAIIREAKEEIGIEIERKDLNIIHIFHSVKNDSLKFVFKVSEYKNDVKNCETDICSELRWFEINNIPNNTIPTIGKEIENIKNGIYFDSNA